MDTVFARAAAMSVAFVLGGATMGTAQDAATVDAPPTLTPERLAADPDLDGATPRGVAFSPDGNLLTYLQGKEDDQLVQDLWAIPIDGGEPYRLVDSDALSPDDVELSEQEKARRERQRVRQSGIVEYFWDKTGDQILVPLDGDLYVVNAADGQARQLTETDAFETDARVSPQGNYVSFIRDNTLYAIAQDSGEERALTPSGEGAISYGVAEFVAQEEMGRYSGYWWSDDEQFVAYTKVDESGVNIFNRVDIGAQGATIIEQRYPHTGSANAVVQLFVRDMNSDDVVEVDLGDNQDIYLARVHWLDGQLIVQRQNREQTRLDVMRADPSTGETAVLFTETADTWLNLHNNFRPINDGEAFLWTSERSGFQHIYVVSADGDVIRQVTSGDWVVSRIAGVNEDAGMVYFEGFRDTPIERHLYEVSYQGDGAEIVRVTAPNMSWGVTMNANATAFVGTSSSPTQPPQVGLYDATGSLIRWIEENALDDDHPYAPYLARHVEPEFGELQAEDGTILHYSLLKPPSCSTENPCPAIIEVYGGPGVQRNTRSWSAADPHDQMYVQNGFVLMRVDNRGSTNRGKAFEDAIYRRMGDVEVRDQLLAADHLKSLDFVDADRLGVTGWSYGGYMALMMLAKAPEVFAAGVSGAPVTDWALYDTHYTERYLGTPQGNPDGYEASSVFPYLSGLTAPVLVIHGMADDNVIFDHATKLFEVLQDENVVFESMVYPGERHGVYGPRQHVNAVRLDYFLRRLK